MAINEVNKVPLNKGKIPKCFSVNKGVHCVSVKKSTIDTSVKKFIASIERTKIMPTVTAIVIKALENSDLSIISSLIRLIKLFILDI